MSLFFIDYDLRKTRNYDALYDALGKIGAKPVLESLWYVTSTSYGATELRDYLLPYIDADDGILVTNVAGWAKGGRLLNNLPESW